MPNRRHPRFPRLGAIVALAAVVLAVAPAAAGLVRGGDRRCRLPMPGPCSNR